MDDSILKDGLSEYRRWDSVCKEILKDDYVNWKPLCEVELETGNPMYSLYQVAGNKAIRILRNPHTQQCGMFLKKTGTTDMIEDDIDELIFFLPFNDTSIEFFRTIFCVWIHPDTNARYIEDFIHRSSCFIKE